MALSALLAGCGTSSHLSAGSDRTATPTTTEPSRSFVPPPSDCRPAACPSLENVTLSNGYQLRLRTGQDAQRLPVPVVELDRNGSAVDWWVSTHADGAATLTCLVDAPVPNCAVLAPAGAHSGSAELLTVQNGKLVVGKDAFVVSDTPFVRADDLDGDGYLDIIAGQNDYRPSFAQGHEFEQTFRYVPTDGTFAKTGCSPLAAPGSAWFTPPALLTGSCPKVGG